MEELDPVHETLDPLAALGVEIAIGPVSPYTPIGQLAVLRSELEALGASEAVVQAAGVRLLTAWRMAEDHVVREDFFATWDGVTPLPQPGSAC